VNKGNNTITELRAILQRDNQNPQVINDQVQQKCIDNLCTNCKTWGLDINIKRTKSIVFSSSGRINKTDFKYDYKPIEKGRSYKYLGINIINKAQMKNYA
jgi:hypothetical protein